uniref:RRM domain-containing protein n=1 Tax=Oryza punctata TaxID=4537 RepID=A0A0E0JPF9_ORYPU
MTRRRRGKRGRASPDPPAKRRRRGPPELEANELEAPPTPVPAPSAAAAPEPSLVMVAGLPPGCGVMELKSRLGAYGPIARTRIDAASATGYVTFRSGADAMAAIAASLDPDGGVTVGSKKVLVVQASEAPNNSRSIDQANPAGETTHDATKRNASESSAFSTTRAAPEGTYKAREIIAYDDLF